MLRETHGIAKDGGPRLSVLGREPLDVCARKATGGGDVLPREVGEVFTQSVNASCPLSDEIARLESTIENGLHHAIDEGNITAGLYLEEIVHQGSAEYRT